VKKAARKAKRPSKTKHDDLPASFQGAEVVRGLGIVSDDLDKHLDRNAMDRFDATKDMWLVLDDCALEDLDDSVEVKGFATKEDALVFARARSNGNINHRVLRVTEQVLVVATRNSL
jgi:hypothetical protein